MKQQMLEKIRSGEADILRLSANNGSTMLACFTNDYTKFRLDIAGKSQKSSTRG